MATSCCRRTLPLSVDWSAGGPRPVGVPFCRRKIWPRPRFESDTGCEETSVWSTCELLKKGQSVSDMEKATFLFPHTLEDTATTTRSSAPASSARRRPGPGQRGDGELARQGGVVPPGRAGAGMPDPRRVRARANIPPQYRIRTHARGAARWSCQTGGRRRGRGVPGRAHRRRCRPAAPVLYYDLRVFAERDRTRPNPGRAAALRRAKAASPRRSGRTVLGIPPG